MEKQTNYLTALLTTGLNIRKKDSLFISIPTKCQNEAMELERIAKKLGVDDIHIFFNDSMTLKRLNEYVEKNAKFLFFLDENTKTLNMRIINDLINNDIEINYTVANLPVLDTEFDKDIYDYSSITSEDAVTGWNKLIDHNQKIVSQIKNLKLNYLKVENLKDTVLNMQVTGSVVGNNEINKMKLFPNYKIEIIPKEGTTNGYVEATSTVLINDTEVEDLQLFIKDGNIIDFDCYTGGKEAKQFLDKSLNPMIEAVGLLDKEIPTYDMFTLFKNIVLDRTSKPYVLVSSYDSINNEKNYLYVPIASGCLKVSGTNQKGKNIPLYENEGFSKKITLK